MEGPEGITTIGYLLRIWYTNASLAHTVCNPLQQQRQTTHEAHIIQTLAVRCLTSGLVSAPSREQSNMVFSVHMNSYRTYAQKPHTPLGNSWCSAAPLGPSWAGMLAGTWGMDTPLGTLCVAWSHAANIWHADHLREESIQTNLRSDTQVTLNPE